MAAATVQLRLRNNVSGHLRQIAVVVAFAASGDTFVVPGMKIIYDIGLEPTTNAFLWGFTVTGNTLTLQSGGALTFRGTVTGL